MGIKTLSYVGNATTPQADKFTIVNYAGNFDAECGEIFENTVTTMRNEIKSGKAKIHDLVTKEKESIAKEKARNTEVEKNALLNEKRSSAVIISKEIELRANAIIEKCNCTKLDDVGDFQILERSKNLVSIDSELREVFNKYSKFSNFASYIDEKDVLLKNTHTFQDKALCARNAYAKKLHSIITDRDISEEKLKKSSGLNIELAKFKGYESKLDIYSFKRDFERLIQPNILKK